MNSIQGGQTANHRLIWDFKPRSEVRKIQAYRDTQGFFFWIFFTYLLKMMSEQTGKFNISRC